MLLVSTNTIRTTNQMSEKMLVLIYTFQSIHILNLLWKTSKDRLPLPVVNLDKASVCGDWKTSFSFRQKRTSSPKGNDRSPESNVPRTNLI